MKKHIQKISSTVARHTTNTIANVRQKPYETRRQIIIFLTAFCTFLLVVGWISLLKHELGDENKSQNNTTQNATDFIRQDINRVYKDATVNTPESVSE